MWEWNDYSIIDDNELYHYGVLGMKWGTHRAARYFRKAGKNYGQYLKYKDKSDKLAKKAAEKSVTTIYDKSNNSYTHKINMKTLNKYDKKIQKLSDIGQKYISRMNEYNKKGVSIMNKYNIKKGKDFIYKNFDEGVISGRTNYTPYGLAGGIVGTSIGINNTYNTLKNQGQLHEEYYKKK